jgi:hypothetical protein
MDNIESRVLPGLLARSFYKCDGVRDFATLSAIFGGFIRSWLIRSWRLWRFTSVLYIARTPSYSPQKPSKYLPCVLRRSTRFTWIFAKTEDSDTALSLA